MSRPIFYAYASRRGPEGNTKAFLNLPATPYEMLDVMDQLRLGRDDAVKVRIDEYYSFLSVAPLLADQNDLLELNALAQKLSELDDDQATAFEGLLEIKIRAKEGPIELPDIINMAYSTQSCQLIGEALNDSQLGYYCAKNGLIPEVDNLPEPVFELLDFERLGREYRQKNHGIFVERTADHSGGYIEQQGELTEAYKDLDLTLKMPNYTILLQVSKGFFNDPDYDSNKTALLKLPAGSAELDAILDSLDTWDWREAGWTCMDCSIPALADAVSDADDIDFLNSLAQKLADMAPKDLTAYKALMEATNCRDLSTAEQLIDTLDQYIFSPQYGSPTEVAKGQLSLVLAEPEASVLVPHLDLPGYGKDLMQTLGSTLTSYGLIERKDHQPILAPQQDTQKGEMTLA